MSKPKPGEGLKCYPMTAEQLAAFEKLYERHYMALVRSIIGWYKGSISYHDVEDVAAEAWNRAFRFFALYDPSRGEVEAWMNTLARRVLQDWARRRQVRVQDVFFSQPLSSEEGHTVESAVTATETVPVEAEDMSTSPRVRLAAEALCQVMGPRSARAVQLQLQGLSHATIAQNLRISEQASKSLVCRGYASVRRRLAVAGIDSPAQLLERYEALA